MSSLKGCVSKDHSHANLRQTYRVMTSFSSSNFATFSTSPLCVVRRSFVRSYAVLDQ